MHIDTETTACLLCGSDNGDDLVRSAAQMSSSTAWFRFVRCRLCGLVYLNPRVAERAIDAWYGPEYLPHRGESAWGRYARFAAEGQRRTDRARVRVALGDADGLSPGSRVLDVGCGRPTFLEALHDAAGVSGTGVDVSDAGWRDDPARWRRSKLELVVGRIEDVELSSGYDLITLWHALEHDYRPLATLTRLRAMARPGATLIVEVPDYDSLTRRLQGPNWAGYHTPRHTAVYTAATLGDALGRTGWRVARQRRRGTLDPFVVCWLGRQEQLRRSLDGTLESRFPAFMLGKVLTLPLVLTQAWLPLGVQLAVARAG